MLQKLNSVHANNKCFLRPRNIHDTRFGIIHFAGEVYYQVEGFLEKNRDVLSTDILILIHSSKNKFLKEIFNLESPQTKLGHGTIRQMKAGSQLLKPSDPTKRPLTLGGQFKQSLEQLMRILSHCQPYFIRCIKPNEYKKPLLFDRELCIQQLRYSGMMETVQIRKSGFPIRYTFDEFSQRFRMLLPSPKRKQFQDKHRQMTLSIADLCLGTDKDWKVGRTKIFLKEHQDTMLEIQRSQALDGAAISIQRVLRGHKYRKEFLRQRQAAVTLQAVWRGHCQRKNFELILVGFKRLQAIARSHLLMRQFQAMRQKLVQLQAHCRGYLVRQQVQAKKRAVVTIQAHARGLATRRNLRQQKTIVGDHLVQREGPPIILANEPKGQGAVPDRKRKSIYDTVTDTEMVEKVFGFLPAMIGGQEGPAPTHFEDLEVKTQKLLEIDLDTVPMTEMPEEDVDGLAEYTFPKFAATYFQKSASHTHIQKPLRYPLLYHENDTDHLAALAVWPIILRFMGDLPEPVLYARNSLSGSSVTKQIHDRPGKDKGTQGPQHNEYVQVARKLNVGKETFKSDVPVSERPMSNVEKVHFIVGYAIMRPGLRDEIYCQICKQLSENYKTGSRARGWILLSLCLGCFPPSERFMKYLLNFIGQGPASYGPFCAERLQRTFANGVRAEPPTWLELQAVKSKKHIPIQVILATGGSLTISVDSASTSQEICQHIIQKQGLRDHLGFSLQVAVYDKFWSLGSGSDHVMDAVAQCEQLTQERGESQRQSPWRIYFRKEFFTPWHDSREDPVSTELIYYQVIRGVWSGEYNFEKEEELVELLARHCYVQLGATVKSDAVRELLPSCVPSKLYRTKPPEKWASIVTAAHAKAPYIQSKATPLAVKEQTVEAARLLWPLLFSRLFEVTTLSGPRLPKTQLILAINWKGMCFLDQKERTLLELSFAEVMGLVANRDAPGGQRLLLSTLHEEYEFISPSSVAIADLVALFLGGLKERSVFAMALQDRKATADDATLLPFKKGDLLILTKKQGLLTSENWILGQNDRTGKTGLVPMACLYIIPSVTKPSTQMLSLLAMSPEKRKLAVQEVRGAEPLPEEQPTESPYTLEEFAYQYFRYSEERAWQLLWLCTGLFPPGKMLLPHAQKFIDSRRKKPLAPDCSRRLHRVLRMGPRKQPPHHIEVKAAEQNTSKLCHEVYLPNDTSKTMEVGSNSRVRDLCESIATKLKMASWDGCSLFIKITDKVISLKEGDFFFDSLRQVSDWVKKNRPQKEGAAMTLPYQVLFMRKLWLNVTPGKDVNADTILHYHQELPKYLRGFHKCSREDAIHLAGLIYRVQFGSDRSQLASVSKILKELSLLLEFDRHKDKTEAEAKVDFLKWIYRWPTFGSSFFEVKQTSEPSYPDILLIAINRHGLLLIHPKTKELLTTYPFTKISSWSSGSTYFHMALGSLGQGSRLLCETSLGYKMDDLLTSYVQQLMSAVNKQRGSRAP
ncbi:hypothetical protein STEG23_016344 [Scotinomys teguina]